MGDAASSTGQDDLGNDKGKDLGDSQDYAGKIDPTREQPYKADNISPTLLEFARSAFGSSWSPLPTDQTTTEQPGNGLRAQEVQSQLVRAQPNQGLFRPPVGAPISAPQFMIPAQLCVGPGSFLYQPPAYAPAFGNDITSALPLPSTSLVPQSSNSSTNIQKITTPAMAGPPQNPPEMLRLPFEDSDGDDDFAPNPSWSRKQLLKRKEVANLVAHRDKEAEKEEAEVGSQIEARRAAGVDHGAAQYVLYGSGDRVQQSMPAQSRSFPGGQVAHVQRSEVGTFPAPDFTEEKLGDARKLIKKMTTWGERIIPDPIPRPNPQVGATPSELEPTLRKCPGLKNLGYAAPFWTLTTSPAFLVCGVCYKGMIQETPLASWFVKSAVMGGHC